MSSDQPTDFAVNSVLEQIEYDTKLHDLDPTRSYHYYRQPTVPQRRDKPVFVKGGDLLVIGMATFLAGAVMYYVLTKVMDAVLGVFGQ